MTEISVFITHFWFSNLNLDYIIPPIPGVAGIWSLLSGSGLSATTASVGNTHAFGLVGKKEYKGFPASFVKKMIMNKSLADIGGAKELFAKGRFDLYH